MQLMKFQLIKKKHDNVVKSPNSPNLFGIIHLTQNCNTKFISLSEVLSSTRKYFGPITIHKFHVTLEDDRGNIVNLRGHNWSFIIKATTLYQY